VRWTHPDVRRRWGHVLDDKPQADRFRLWVESLDGRVMPDDPRLLDDSWDPLSRGVADGRLTFGAYFESYLDGVESDATRAKYRERINARAKDWLTTPLVQCDRVKLDELIKRMNGEDITPSTAYNALTLISAVLSAAFAERKIDDQPFTAAPSKRRRKISVRKVTGYDNKPRRVKDHELYIPPQEWQKLLAAAKELGTRIRRYGRNDPWQLYYMLWLMTQTGIRIGEALATQVCDFIYDDPESPFIDLSRTRQRDGTSGPTKSRKDRIVAVSPDLGKELFERYCEGREPGAALFPASIRGDLGWRYENWYGHRWKRLLKLAREEFDFNPRLKIYPHALRATYITWSFNDGVPARDIAEQVGHTSERITRGYDLGSDRRAVRAFQSKIRPE
jgi:integrase